MKIRFLVVPLLAAGLVLTGCDATKPSKPREPSYADARNDQFINVNKEAAEELLFQLAQKTTVNSADIHTMLISTLVNIDNLQESSTLGRIVSEQISARFTSAGYRMVELKFHETIYVEGSGGGGEFMLSRNTERLAHAYAAQAVVVGSYAQSNDFVYINLKVIRPDTNAVLATHDYALPLNHNNKRMLRSTR